MRYGMVWAGVVRYGVARYASGAANVRIIFRIGVRRVCPHCDILLLVHLNHLLHQLLGDALLEDILD